ncbi:KdsC family phosphatase [Cyanobium sp. ATX 6F1]|uniref:KdsC family phosphatase n=1 Tax=unclassified Cyanobium TaxID=2627006 RepID=UPI0020CF978F|nr:HAD hydrolase family protein [Cyanobium sp. ATX 6F1]MCP9915157.1 HAD hydrolase family protein [Cyanobium sp. ATX 6F1]
MTASTKFQDIKAIALDVDGVLTDGSFWWGPNGEEWKRFCFADIMGISIGQKAGLIFSLISGEGSPLVDRFAAKMGIKDVFKDCNDKASALRTFANRNKLALSQVAFMGDDVNDLEALDLAGYSAAPANAQKEVMKRASYTSELKGGEGAVRDFIELTLKRASQETQNK